MNDVAQARRVRNAILNHLREHPDASDTADGIRTWWLRATDLGSDLELVESVLDELVRAGIMRRRNLPDGGVLYAAARPSGI